MEHDMVTMEAAAAYFRIVRLNMRDVSPITAVPFRNHRA